MAVMIKGSTPDQRSDDGEDPTGDQFFTFCTFASPLLFSMLLYFLMA